MIERFLIETRNFGVAPFMIGMARSALLSAEIWRPAMVTNASADVACNIFVTIEAKRVLVGPPEWFVAGRALGFEVRMSLYNFAGHHKRLNGLSGGGIADNAD
jgi:hypothetical protein